MKADRSPPYLFLLIELVHLSKADPESSSVLIKPDLFSWRTQPTAAARTCSINPLHLLQQGRDAGSGLETCSLIDLINKTIDGEGWVNYYQLQAQLWGHTHTRFSQAENSQALPSFGCNSAYSGEK